ncbi:Uncharacterised protein [uncultured archaeon]|nr:Uncharacterised protein [uncultured archaeon]
MKIACLLGVSKYKNINELRSCENDIALMKSVLEATDEIIMPLAYCAYLQVKVFV